MARVQDAADITWLDLGDHRLEARWFGSGQGPVLVFLHEGLGCLDHWRDFPEALAHSLGLRAFVYSRRGYGRSDACELPRPLDYMQQHGEHVLPRVLSAAGIDEAILIGHSDGASIALVYAGSALRPGLRGLLLEAPHVFTEPPGLEAIARAREAYNHGDLRQRLMRYHGDNVDCAFRGWNDAWLDPDFKRWNIESYLPGVGVPVLVLQGLDDPYGTTKQVDAIAHHSGAPVAVELLPECGHAPHREQRDETLAVMSGFIRGLLEG